MNLPQSVPAWFVKLFKTEVDNVPYGEEYEKGAQRLWDKLKSQLEGAA